MNGSPGWTMGHNGSWEEAGAFLLGSLQISRGSLSLRPASAPRQPTVCLCETPCNRCHPRKNNCQWESFFMRGGFKTSENDTTAVWSITAHLQSGLLWSALSVFIQCSSRGKKTKKILFSEKSLLSYMLCATCDLSSLSTPSLARLSPLLLVFKGSSASPQLLVRPSNLFLPLQDKCRIRGLCSLPTSSLRIYDVTACVGYWHVRHGGDLSWTPMRELDAS